MDPYLTLRDHDCDGYDAGCCIAGDLGDDLLVEIERLRGENAALRGLLGLP